MKENIDKYWNFPTCKLCSYRSKSSFFMYQHEHLHATRLKTDFFTCHSKPPELYACEFCGFETNLKVDLTEHFRVFHEGKEEKELKNVLKCFYCKTCDFETHSILVLANHTGDCNSLKQSEGLLEEFGLKNSSKVSVLVEHSYCRSLNKQQHTAKEHIQEVLSLQECRERKLAGVKPKNPHKRTESDLGVVKQTLPDKSKLKYNKAYKTYMDWCAGKRATNIGSESVLLAYFAEEALKKKPSTLLSIYSMVKSTLLINHQIDISINSKLLWGFLKKQNVGYKPKKSRVLLKEEIDRFLDEAPKEFLPQKVALIIGISGACRIDELHQMKLRDVEFSENRISIVVSDSKTNQSRSFIINNQKWIAIIQEYVDLRKDIENENFFIQMPLGKITNQHFSYKSLELFPKKIATYLQLSNINEYTAHCFRRTVAVL